MLDWLNWRRANTILMYLWIFPGIPISYVLRNSIAWVVFLSVYAIIATHNAGARADAPNPEQEDK